MRIYFRGREHIFYIVQVPALTGLAHSVCIWYEPAFVVESQSFLRTFELVSKQHVCDNASTGPAFAVIAMDGHHSVHLA